MYRGTVQKSIDAEGGGPVNIVTTLSFTTNFMHKLHHRGREGQNLAKNSVNWFVDGT